MVGSGLTKIVIRCVVTTSTLVRYAATCVSLLSESGKSTGPMPLASNRGFLDAPAPASPSASERRMLATCSFTSDGARRSVGVQLACPPSITERSIPCHARSLPAASSRGRVSETHAGGRVRLRRQDSAITSMVPERAARETQGPAHEDRPVRAEPLRPSREVPTASGWRSSACLPAHLPHAPSMTVSSGAADTAGPCKPQPERTHRGNSGAVLAFRAHCSRMWSAPLGGLFGLSIESK